MAGRFFAVVGPSGAGKDTLMAEVKRARPEVVLARRVITRPAEAGGEPFEGVSAAEFESLAAIGAFLLSWDAHGLRYGVPARIEDDLSSGRDVLANLSRRALPEALARRPDMIILNITATPDILAKRLHARGREAAADRARRLARSVPLPVGARIVTIDNSGPLADAVAAILAALDAERVAP